MSESSRSLPSARTFYEEVGGAPTFTRLIAHFYAAVRTDPVIGPLYPQDDWEGAEVRLRSFLEQYWGGPTTYSQERGHPRLRMRHAPFAIDVRGRDRWVELMEAALAEVQLPEQVVPPLKKFFHEAATFMINRE